MKYFCLLLLTLSSFISLSGQVDTVEIYSKTMRKSHKAVVIKPSSYKNLYDYKDHGPYKYPVVYLLHGYSGKYSNWIIKKPELQNLASLYDVLIVCPDGDFSSWYLDSPVDSTMRYETYIGKEVPEYIDQHYSTDRSPKARAISGLSMGGHGALFLALRHPDIFGACGSMSGGVDLSAIFNKFDAPKRLGDTLTHREYWKNYSVINLVEKYNQRDSIAMIIDCGTDDFFYEVNHKLHEKMLKLKIPHDYSEKPGKHEWVYWNNSVEYHLLFFHNYFERNKRKL